MKKLIALLLVLVLFASLIPAAAADNADDFLEAAVAGGNAQVGDLGIYEYMRVGNLCIINFSAEYLDKYFNDAIKKPSTLPIWNFAVTAFKLEQKNVAENLEVWAPEVVLVYNGVSASEPRTVYFTIVAGEVIYDAAAGTSILNPAE